MIHLLLLLGQTSKPRWFVFQVRPLNDQLHVHARLSEEAKKSGDKVTKHSKLFGLKTNEITETIVNVQDIKI